VGDQGSTRYRKPISGGDMTHATTNVWQQTGFDIFNYVDPDVSAKKVKNFKVNLCFRDEIVGFIEKWHYSQNINGISSTYCFKLTDDEHIIGAAIFGKLAMANQWKRFADQEEDVIELRRLCCVDKTPKNTESFFIGAMLRWLKKFTKHKLVVSYADLEHNHVGTIYKASNFECLGAQPGADIIVWNGKNYHDKAIRTKYKGELKPFSFNLKQALERGDAVYKPTAGKVTYTYQLKAGRYEGT
jgi:hypothetical protein